MQLKIIAMKQFEDIPICCIDNLEDVWTYISVTENYVMNIDAYDASLH